MSCIDHQCLCRVLTTKQWQDKYLCCKCLSSVVLLGLCLRLSVCIKRTLNDKNTSFKCKYTKYIHALEMCMHNIFILSVTQTKIPKFGTHVIYFPKLLRLSLFFLPLFLYFPIYCHDLLPNIWGDNSLMSSLLKINSLKGKFYQVSSIQLWKPIRASR